jgi:hypothetical protein
MYPGFLYSCSLTAVGVVKITHGGPSKEIVKGEEGLVPYNKPIPRSDLGQGLQEKERWVLVGGCLGVSKVLSSCRIVKKKAEEGEC